MASRRQAPCHPPDCSSVRQGTRYCHAAELSTLHRWASAHRQGAQSMSIIPLPVHVIPGQGHFALPDTVVVRHAPGTQAVCAYLVNHLQDQLGLATDTADAGSAESAAVTLQCGPGCGQRLDELQLQLPQEAYELRVDEAGVHLAAPEPVGLFYAVQSLIQLLPAQPQGRILLQHIQVGSDVYAKLHTVRCTAQEVWVVGAGWAEVSVARHADGLRATLLRCSLHLQAAGPHGPVQDEPLPLASHRGPGAGWQPVMPNHLGLCWQIPARAAAAQQPVRTADAQCCRVSLLGVLGSGARRPQQLSARSAGLVRQGWRIEIKAFPKLTSKGAWRGRAGAKGYGGFYSQQQVFHACAVPRLMEHLLWAGLAAGRLRASPGPSLCNAS